MMHTSKLLLVLQLSAFFIAATVGQTNPIMGYQSWACKSPLLAPGTNTAAAVTTPTPITAGNMTTPEQPSAAASAIKFLVNVAWGPPNTYIAGYNPNAPQILIDQIMLNRALPSFAAGTIEWSSTLSPNPANGFPLGCCGGVGAVTVAELGCRFCINSGTQTLPTIASTNTDYAVTQAQVVQCSGQAPYQVCTQGAGAANTIVPGTLFSQAGGSNTDSITTGSGVTTLSFPSNPTAVLAGGIYTFQLWAESICGVKKSSDVQLAARCPPSPVVQAFLRQVPAQVGTPSDVIPANTDNTYTVTVGSSALVDASCSFPFQLPKPNWPIVQTSTPQPPVNSLFNPTRNLFAIQKVYFSVADSQMTYINGAAQPTSVVATGTYFSSTPISDWWGAVATFRVAGVHRIVITATDGCSVGQAIITVNAICQCAPVAKAMYVPTIWSNQAGTNPVSNQLNNAATSSTTLLATANANTDQVGLPQDLYTYQLSASAFDYETAAPTGNLAYDWSFVYWVPDYSNVFTKAAQPAQSLAQVYLSSGGSIWPPTQGSQCSPTGVVPLACAQGWWGLTADPQGAQRCCFSAQNDIVTNIGAVTRPAKGSFLYKVLQVVTTPGVPLRNPVTTPRIKVYNFMRISSGCSGGATSEGAWSTISTVQTGMTAGTVTYYALPTFLQYAQNGQQMGSSQNYADFNGFPSVNTATPAAGTGPFRPTTECGAWLKTQQWTTTFSQLQSKVNTTVSCGRNTDLVLCRVTISQIWNNVANTFTYNTPTATLSVSSFGSCKGQWQFVLSVDDSCQNATDYFNVRVGCNRAPAVSAGCTNTQTWSALTGTAQFEQISLDGRATYDPDNFVDAFYNLNAQAGSTFPECVGGTPLSTTPCANGGLGSYGLTYAWALLNYFNPQGQLVYPIVNATTNQITGCPTNLANIQRTCVQSYCSGTTWVYPIVNSLTRQYDIAGSPNSAAQNAKFSTSVQGTLSLSEAWQWGFYAVNPVQFGTNGFNLMPVYDNGGSTMTQQMIFPDFNAACAPTVFPMFFASTTNTVAYSGATPANMFDGTLTDWQYAQQIKHVGNSAYMGGLVNAGMYTARLYAFDGCSVGFADVTFTLECPTMTFAPNTNWGLYSSYQAGNSSVTYTPPEFVVNYAGTQEIVVSGTAAVYAVLSNVNNQPVLSATPTAYTCSFSQKGSVANKDVPPSSRTMDMAAPTAAACKNLLFTNGGNVWLNPGMYVIVASVTDGCNRGFSVTLQSPVFTVTCPAAAVNLIPYGTLTNGQSLPAVSRTLAYTVPSGATPGQFPTFTFNVTASSPRGNNQFNDVQVSWVVYWRPATGTAPAATATGFPGTPSTTGFLNTGAPASNVFSVYASNTGANVQPGVLNYASTVPGASRTIQYGVTGALVTNVVTLAARTATDSVAGLVYNTITSVGQQAFSDQAAQRSSYGIAWAGDYYVRVTGIAYINGALSACSASTSNDADQLFTVTCPAAVDVSGSVTSTAVNWAVGGNNVITGRPANANPYFGALPFESGSSYCTAPVADAYCINGAVGGGSGSFRPATLEIIANTAGFYTNGAASSVSYRLSYKGSTTFAANFTVAASGVNNYNFLPFAQNPLMFSPFAYLGVGGTGVTKAWSGNAASQPVMANLPGTWTINVFNTNGCANITGATSYDLSAYCYDPQMSEASLAYYVYARVPPAGCAAAQTSNDLAGIPQCDVTATAVTACPNVAIVRGPLARPVGTAFARRRLLEEEENTPESSRKLLQTPVSTFSPCSLNTNSFTPAGVSVVNPSSNTASTVTSVNTFGSTPILSPNYGAVVQVFFNSFDVTSSPYFPSNTDLRNFYGMGDLFGDGKLAFSTGSGAVPSQLYQGAFETLIITVDTTKSTIRVPNNANTNNQVVQWYNYQNWAGGFTVGANNAAPTFTATPPPTGFPAGYSTQCSWAPVGTLSANSNGQPAAYNAGTDIPMVLQGCNSLPTANPTPIAAGTFTSSAATAGIIASTPSGLSGFTGLTAGVPALIVSQRPLSPASGAAAVGSTLFSMSSTGIYAGRLSSMAVANGYDFQAIAWNGPVGRSCYDYRAVRVLPVCNRIVPYDITTGATGNPTYRGSATEGPLLIGNLVSAPSGTPVKTTISAGASQNVNWMTGMFDAVNVTAGFKYLQCGSAAAPTGFGGADPSGVICGSVPGSRDGEGNYYSLQYSWVVVSAPTNSVFNPATVNGTSTVTFGNFVVNSTNVDTADPDRTVTTQTFVRTNTISTASTQRWVRLLNHGYMYPMTTLRPDVAGTYQLQLQIADGCSTWQSQILSVTANCVDLATSLGVFSNFVQVRVGGAAAITPATTLPAGVPANSIAYTATIDGSQYVRITLSSAAVAPAGYFLTYNWAVTPVTPGLPAPITGVPTTNMQGSVASFVPSDLTDNIPATFSTNIFRVDLTVASLCQTGNGPQTAVFTAYIVVTCQLDSVTSNNFIFFTPYVNTYAQNPASFWGINWAGGQAQFITSKQNTTTNLYYRQNMVVRTATTSNTGSALTCDPTGPYCGPYNAAGATAPANIPTILFAGSVPHSTGLAGQVGDNQVYFQTSTGVWGAGWQQLYFNVPVALTPNICKIKATYWVLTNYQNALPYVPAYMPIQTAAAPTCIPKQDWSWTVISTPCQTCNCNGASTTCAEMDSDVCDFTPNFQYQYRSQNVQISVGGIGQTQTRINTGYAPPTFNLINTQVSGNQGNGMNLAAYCVYDDNMRLSALPNIANLRTNCRVSGRGLSVDILQVAATNQVPANTGCDQSGPGNSFRCQMNNIAFVPNFPGPYTLQLSVYDYCGPPVLQTVTVNAQCRLKPAVTVLSPSIVTFYDCQDPTVNGAWGNPNTPGQNPPLQGKFDPVIMSSLITATGITAVNDTQQVLPSVRSGACAVAQPKQTWNCTDVKNYVNAQNVMVDSSDGTNNKFKACCTCLYGTQTINLFGNGGTTPTNKPPTPGGNTPTTPGSTTQQNILALDDSEYNRNSIILIALVTPMAVILVGSLAGNVLMVLKMRQGAAASGGFNVRAGDVELSTSPRARVDV